LAPAAQIWGWSAALLLSMAIGLAAALIIAPARERLDIERDPDRAIGLRVLFNPHAVAAPFLLLKANTTLLSVTALAFSFAFVQGSLFSFSVTFLVVGRHMPLATAGLVYACMQFAGVAARIILGWFADRTGRPARNLTVQAFVAALLVTAYGSLPNMPPIWLAAMLSGATGFFAASWNGIYMAEVARLSPKDRMIEATSSSVMVTFLGYVCGPSVFSILVTATGGYRVPFAVASAQLALMAMVQTSVLVSRGHNRARRGGG
jgi:predicted MFS family arabinose efflux permease